MPEPLDELTLRRAQRGDERAWRALIDHHQHVVNALIWRLFAGRARHRVEDLVQETFVRVIGAIGRFDPAGTATLSTWILTIATRLALNELRRPEYGTASTIDADAALPPERPDAATDRRQRAAALERAVAALPDGQRAVLVLREYDELEYIDIAHVLELDVGTVKSRLARARATLREQLAELQGAS